MRRIQAPYYGAKYVLDIKTGVTHDLDNEKLECNISGIKSEYAYISNVYYTDIKLHPDSKDKCKHCMGTFIDMDLPK